MSVRDGFIGYTEGGAESVGVTNQGHLHPGAVADIVVYNKNIFDTPTDDLQSLELIDLFVDGKQIR